MKTHTGKILYWQQIIFKANWLLYDVHQAHEDSHWRETLQFFRIVWLFLTAKAVSSLYVQYVNIRSYVTPKESRLSGAISVPLPSILVIMC